MRTLPFALLCLATAAQASPLEPLWEKPYKGDCAHTVAVRWRTDIVAADGRSLVRFDAATGRPGGKDTLGPPPPASATPSVGWGDEHPGVRFAVGDVLLGTDAHGWVAYDGAKGAALWRRDQQTGDAGIPSAQPAGDAVLVLRPGGEKRGSIVELVEATTGKSLWHVETGKEMRAWLGSDAERVYVATTPAVGAKKGHLHAYEIKTGKLLYTIDLAPPVNPAVTNAEAQDIQDADAELPDTIAIDSGALILPVPGEGLRLYDAKTGHDAGRIGAPEVRRFGVTGLVAAAGHAYFFVRKAEHGAPDGIEAVELGSKKLLWRKDADLGNWAVLRADSVLTVETDSTLRVLAATTGATMAEWGRAGAHLVFAHRDASAPAILLCGDGKLSALDPSGKEQLPEKATVEGTLRCACGKHPQALAGVRVTAAGESTVTDKAGHYKLPITGRGSIAIDVDLPKLEDGIEWTGDPPIVRLTGKHGYKLGTTSFDKQSQGD